MIYDDSSRRRNLLTGLVFGAVLGAGLALLFAPGEGVGERARYVLRSTRRLGRAGRRTRAYARALRASIGEASSDAGLEYEVAGPLDDRYGADELDGADEAEFADDVVEGEAGRPRRVRRMAKRRFEL